MINKIYIPISFSSSIKILTDFKELLEYLKNYDLSSFEISNHPTTKKSIKHLNLIESIRALLKNHKGGIKKISNTSICVGFTSSVIEALFYGVSVFHITEEPIFESYDNNFWKNITVKEENRHVREYLTNNKNFVLFGKDDSIIKKYI